MCGPPAVPLNAKVKTVSGDLGIYEASYECDSGYELFGPSTTKCDPKNGWEKDLPFCGKSILVLALAWFSIFSDICALLASTKNILWYDIL